MSSELMALLAETTLATSAVVVLVLLLRWPMRAAFGSGAAYALWALVPIALIALLLPAPVHPVVLVPIAARIGAVQAVAAAPAASFVPWELLLTTAWASGAVALACLQLWQQRRFLRRLGPMRVHLHGLRVAATSAGLPAVTGVLRPRIVLPADFMARYDAEERALVVAHERQHIARGDLPCNALVALLRCVYWFNPLLHWAVARYRHDQELACDARVLARHPRARRTYAQAMLKTQLDDFALPVGCHWHTHPIKERIAMLKRPRPRRWQTSLSSALLLTLSAGVGYAAWAQQPAHVPQSSETSKQYSVAFDVNADGERHHFGMRNLPDVPMAFAIDTDAGRHWVGTFRVVPTDGGNVVVHAQLDGGNAGGISRELTTRLDERATVAIDGRSVDGASLGHFGVAVVVSEVADSTIEATSEAVAEANRSPLVMRGNVKLTTPDAGAPVSLQADAAEVNGGGQGARVEARLPAPAYPKEAANAGVTGEVVVLVDVAPDGSPAATTIESSQPAGVFDAVVLKAVRTWKFVPAMKDGKPVAGRLRIPIDFDLDQPSNEVAEQAAVRRPDYVWFNRKAGESLPKEMNCDVLTATNSEKGKASDLACGIRKPGVAAPPNSGPQSNLQPSPAPLGGGAQVLADVAADGTASNVRLDTDRAPNVIERAIMKALANSRQAPAMKNGRAVAGTAVVDVNAGIPAPPGFAGER